MTAATLSLPSVLDLSAASPLRVSLIARRGADLDVDASNVDRVGGLCLQILLAARQAWTLDRYAFRLVHPSEQFRDALSLAWVDAALGMEP